MTLNALSRRTVVLVLASGALATLAPRRATAGGEVPAADKVSPAITKYYRLRPGVATSARLNAGAVAELKALGFATVLDLRGPDEGVEAERQAAEAAGLRHLNIPVTTVIPTDAQVAQFARVVEDERLFPLLVHCGSASRVGAMWALYRAAHGAPASAALEEGRAIGLAGERDAATVRRLAAP